MNRRQFLAAVPGLAAAGAAPSVWGQAPPKVVVVGAGIMGASIAYHLAGRGADVTVLDKARPGSGATQGAFAMLISAHPEGPRAFSDLYGKAILDWRRLDAELGGAIPVQWGGTITWTAPGEGVARFEAGVRQARSWGVAMPSLSAADIVRLAPGVVPGPFGAGAYSASEGTVDPQTAVDVLVERAKALGVRFRSPVEVTGLITQGGKVAALETSQGKVAADMVVIAAGAGTDQLAGLVGAKAPHGVVSGTLAHSKPHPRLLERVLNGPTFSLKQNPDGRFVTGLDYRPGADGTDVSRAYGEKLLAEAARTLPGLRGVELDTMTVGYVPIPKDSQPIMGFCGTPTNLYLALTMSGITMAPLMGRLAAAEIVEGQALELLAPYRPARFA